MPTYQYRCTSCDTELEAVQKFTDDPLTVCPECSGNLRKVYSAVGVVFKGSGFYATDNRPKGKHGSAKAGEKHGEKHEKHGEKHGEKHAEKHAEKHGEKHGEKSSSDAKPKSSEAKPASSTGSSSAA